MKTVRTALADGRISCHALTVADCLLWNAGRRHGQPTVRASLRRLRQRTRLARDTILKALAELAAIGMLGKIKHRVLVAWGHGSIASRQATNEYEILAPATESMRPTACTGKQEKKEVLNRPPAIPSLDRATLDAIRSARERTLGLRID